MVVFLDRDGVINRNRDDYVKTVDEFEFLPGALEGLAKLKEAEITTIVISNQAGVGRGLIDPVELKRIHDKMLDGVTEAGGEISGLYFCPHRRDEDCECRKPKTGLLQQASGDLGFNLADAYLIGDARNDIEAGCAARCTTVLVLTGKSSAEEIEAWDCRPHHVAADLPSAVHWVLSQIPQP